MSRPFVVLALLVAGLVCGSSPSARAQTLKPGPYYEDKTDLGFKVQVPKDWTFVPPKPNDPNMIGKYVAPNNGGLITRRSGTWTYEAHLVKFDRRPRPASDDPKQRMIQGAGNLKEYVDQALGEAVDDWKPAGEKKTKIGKLEAVEVQFTGKLKTEEHEPVRIYAMLLKLTPEVDVAVVFNGPGDDKKWGKFESAAEQMGRSFKLVELADAGPAATVNTLRDKKRAKLEDEITRLPGWKLHETPNYFLISDSKDEGFLKELMERLEAIRKVYEETYTVEQAIELRRKAAEIAKAEGGEKASDASERTVASPSDAMEASRACVVRVCTDRGMYTSYGGPDGSAGYWSSFHEELVIFDDQKEGGRSNTWKTLNHEAFHQYIFYFYGNLAPHSWYNEGTGDFYSGYQYGKNRKFTLKPFDWRVQPVKDMLREETYVPLPKLVRYSQAEYYDLANGRKNAGNNYAQGWSLIYFLRTANGGARCWKPEWDKILPTYLEALVTTGKLDQAVDRAFEGVDWDAFETCWREYMDKEL